MKALFLLAALAGCATSEPTEPSVVTWVSCPPLTAMSRTDQHALLLRNAELELRYSECRAAALNPNQRWRTGL